VGHTPRVSAPVIHRIANALTPITLRKSRR